MISTYLSRNEREDDGMPQPDAGLLSNTLDTAVYIWRLLKPVAAIHRVASEHLKFRCDVHLKFRCDGAAVGMICAGLVLPLSEELDVLICIPIRHGHAMRFL